MQENHYDPFGMELVGLSRSGGLRQLNQYQFNGKEKQSDFGLNWNHQDWRFYDFQLGRWHAVDPLANLMRRHSPYNYCYNNPIRFIDPDGMSPKRIIISEGTSTDFRTKTFHDTQKQTRKPLVMLKNGEVLQQSKYQGAKSEIAEVGIPQKGKNLPRGTARVDKLISSDKTHRIVETKGFNTTKVNSTEAAQGKMPDEAARGTGTTIQYNPNSSGSEIVNADGTKGRPPYIGLGHEFIHAEQANDGMVDYTRSPGNMNDPDSGLTNNAIINVFKSPGNIMRVNEVKARFEDSAIRAEQGVVQRAQPCLE